MCVGTIGIGFAKRTNRDRESIDKAISSLISLPREKETRAKNSCRLSLVPGRACTFTMERPVVPNPRDIKMIARGAC